MAMTRATRDGGKKGHRGRGVLIVTGRGQGRGLDHYRDHGWQEGLQPGPPRRCSASARRSTTNWLPAETCWWWSLSPPPSEPLAVAAAQDMNITVGYLRGQTGALYRRGGPHHGPHPARRQQFQTRTQSRCQCSEALIWTWPEPSTRPKVGSEVYDPHHPSWGLGRGHDAVTEVIAALRRACNRGPVDRHRPQHRRGRHSAGPPGPPAHRPTLPTGRCRRPGQAPGASPPSSVRF